MYAHPGCVDFSANLNPLGMPEGVRRVLQDNVGAYCQYPDPACRQLTDALAAFETVPRNWVLACAGATDAFWRICAVVRPSRAVVCAPCYSGYEQALQQVGADVSYQHLSEKTNFSFAGFATGYDLAFVANPNNPTGRCVDRNALVACLDEAQLRGAYVVLDECFIDLSLRERSNDLLGRYDNLVLVKAFTKTFALAGLRLGYVLCSNEELLGKLHAVGQPWAVSVPAQLAGVACADAADLLQRSRVLVARERGRLFEALARRGLHVIDGEANFLLFKGPPGLCDGFLSRGILVRSCGNFVGLDERWYRIAVRTPKENDLLIAALEEVVR